MRTTTSIVVHHSVTPRDQTLEKSVASFDENHKRLHPTKNSLGYHIAYHYVIAGDGRRAKTRGLDEIGYHASDYHVNSTSIGICLTGNFDIEQPSEFQIKSFQYLKMELEKKFGPLEILFHNEFSSKSCPGKNMNKEELLTDYDGEGRRMVGEGIWNGERPNEFTTRLETAIMVDRLHQLMRLEDIEMSTEELDWHNIPDGAMDDPEYEFIDDIKPISELKSMFPKNRTNYFRIIHKQPQLQLTQDELKKKSRWCTMYAHFNNALHYGIEFDLKQRKKMIERMIENGPIGENNGASTMDVAKLWSRCLKETGCYKGEVDTYILKTGGVMMRRLIAYQNHNLVSSFIVSKDFAIDREDNRKIDGLTHGGKVYGGHAISYSRLGQHNIGMVNSYSDRAINHCLIPKMNWHNWFSKPRKTIYTYVRSRSAIHIYR